MTASDELKDIKPSFEAAIEVIDKGLDADPDPAESRGGGLTMEERDADNRFVIEELEGEEATDQALHTTPQPRECPITQEIDPPIVEEAHLAAHCPRGGEIDVVAYLVILRIYPLDRVQQKKFKDGQPV